MKKFCFLLLIATLLFSCKQGGQQNKKNDDKPVITVTIEPLRYFTEAIAGDEFTVVSMVPKGSSPETYDPTPQQLVDPPPTNGPLPIAVTGVCGRPCPKQGLFPHRLHRFRADMDGKTDGQCSPPAILRYVRECGTYSGRYPCTSS